SPDGNYVEAKIKKNYVICRKKFDNYLVDMAKEQGAKYYLNHSFKAFEKNSVLLNHKNKVIVKHADLLIGADGPNSSVAKATGLFQGRRFQIGTQIQARMKNDNVVEFYPYIGSYAWIVPVNKDVVRIGVAAYKNAPGLFKKFVKDKIGKNYEKKIIENQSGVIPTFNPRVRAHKDNVFLVGDAAGFVKATSGGGINQSLTAASCLADSIERNLDYDKEWRKKLYRNLHMHLIVHKMMQKFKEKDWNDLIGTFSEKKMKKVLYSESRDKIMSMLLKIAVTKPSLVKYVKYFPFEELPRILG
ncbi:NAD(P)/FAD-dependent oxidoreductase, partial [Candidatus Woesearchaeota archaeon]|nr:NAD(P)/FAD-dependent oxidoreductase [Candidatus Woesearchaeota archaeon]